MPKDEHIVGLDIGSTAIRMAVGQVAPDENGRVHILGAVEVASEGIGKGVVTSLEDAVSSLSACLEQAERATGVPIRNVWVGVSGAQTLAQESRGVVGVSRSDGEIREEDVLRVVEAARTVATPPNYEILHVLPRMFSVDGQVGIKDPVGMIGIRLEVDAQIVQGLSSQLKNLTKSVFRAGLEIEELVYSPLATALAVTTPKQKELGVVVANIGGTTTSIAVFEEGDVLHTAVIPIGSQHITSDIAIGLRTSIDVAERLKIEYGTTRSTEVAKKDEIDLATLGAEEPEMVSKKLVAKIIEARAEEIFERIQKELQRVGRDGKLPAGAVFTGGGAELEGLVDVAKKKLRLPASLGYPLGIDAVTERASDLAFSTAVGLVLWGADARSHGGSSPWGRFSKDVGGNVGKAAGGIKRLFKSFLP
jgi:cell division protein FtsA